MIPPISHCRFWARICTAGRERVPQRVAPAAPCPRRARSGAPSGRTRSAASPASPHAPSGCRRRGSRAAASRPAARASSGRPADCRPAGTIATGGRTSRPTKNTPTSSDPITNSGNAIAASDPSEITLSIQRPANTAASTPSPSESGIIRSAVIPARITRVLDRVRDQRPDRRVLLALCQPDRRVPEIAVDEAAQPVGVLLHRRACRDAAACRAPARRRGLPLRPSTTLAALPGRTWVPTKITTEAARIPASAPSVRRATKRSTGERSRTSGRGAASTLTSDSVVATPKAMRPGSGSSRARPRRSA